MAVSKGVSLITSLRKDKVHNFFEVLADNAFELRAMRNKHILDEFVVDCFWLPDMKRAKIMPGYQKLPAPPKGMLQPEDLLASFE